MTAGHGIVGQWWVLLPGQLGGIFYYIVLPILLLAGIGYVLQRRFGLAMDTLKVLNFYFVMPAIIYFSIVTSTISLGDVSIVVGFALALISIVWLVSYLTGRGLAISPDQRNTLVLTAILFNSGNFGITLQGLTFGTDTPEGVAAVSIQTFVMVTQNIFTFTVGVALAASGHGRQDWRASLVHMVKFPPIYAVLAAGATVLLRWHLDDAAVQTAGEWLMPFWHVLVHAKNAFFAIALLTLGAQLATVSRRGRRYPVPLSVVLRLLLGPVVGFALVWAAYLLLGVSGLTSQVLLIAAASPTAVNCMLLCLEFDNHPEYAAKAVFWSTLLCPLTVTVVVFVARSGVLP